MLVSGKLRVQGARVVERLLLARSDQSGRLRQFPDQIGLRRPRLGAIRRELPVVAVGIQRPGLGVVLEGEIQRLAHHALVQFLMLGK